MDQDEARNRLEAERDRLTAVKAEMGRATDVSERDSISELSTYDQHQADVGTEVFDRERDLGILEAVEGELAEVERALRRLDEGAYGKCEACGKPIADDRLEAQPYTRFCVDDQELAERESRASEETAE